MTNFKFDRKLVWSLTNEIGQAPTLWNYDGVVWHVATLGSPEISNMDATCDDWNFVHIESGRPTILTGCGGAMNIPFLAGAFITGLAIAYFLKR